MLTTERRGVLALAALAASGAVAAWAFDRVETAEPVLLVALAVGWVVLLTAACAGLGHPLFRLAAGARPQRLEDWVVVLASGAGLLVAAAWLLSLAGLLRRGPLAAVLAAAATAGVVWARRDLPHEWSAWRRLSPLACLLGAVGAVSLLAAATLSPFPDQWYYHLAFPYQWLRHGHFVGFPRNYFSFIPANLGFLYTYGLATLGPWAAQVTHWWLGALALAGVAALALRLGGPAAAAWAVAIGVTSPTFLSLSTWAGSDLGIAAFGCAAWVLLLRSSDREQAPRPYLWGLAGAFVGLAAGCKYAGLTSVALPTAAGLAIVLWQERAATPLGPLVARGATFVLAAALVFAPWLVRNLVATGNPLYPFASGLLGGEDGAAGASWIASFDYSWRHLLSGLDLGAVSLPMDGTPPFGPLFLVLVAPALLLLPWRSLPRRHLLLGAGFLVGVTAWLPGPQSCRWLLPALLPACALLGDGFARLLTRLEAAPRRAVLVLAVLLMAWSLQVAVAPGEVDRVACTLGQKSIDSIMRQWVSLWPALGYVNERLPADARLLLVAETRCLLLDRDVLLEDGVHTPLLLEIVEGSADAAAAAAKLQALGVTHVLMNRQEAARICRMTGRSEFFVPTSPAAAQRLADLFAQRLETLWEEGGVTVYRLR